MGQEPGKESLKVRITEGAHRLVERTENGGLSPVDSIAQEVDELRFELDRTLEELRRRRHRAMHVGWLIKEHGGGLLVVGIGLAALGAFLLAYAESRARKRTRWSAKAARVRERTQRFRQAISRAIDRPERVAPADPTLGHRLLERAALFTLERGLSMIAQRAGRRGRPALRSA
jgi:hypothetical protein